jgi:UDP:flavonoid glycosyltransferase YjiC (YdhE family)
MKLALIAYGTRGDVQPFLSLAWALQERGHTVRLIAPRNTAAWIQRAALPSLGSIILTNPVEFGQ